LRAFPGRRQTLLNQQLIQTVPHLLCGEPLLHPALCSPLYLPLARFPVELVGVVEVHAAFLNESRTRGRVQRSVQEIRAFGYLSLVVSVVQP